MAKRSKSSIPKKVAGIKVRDAIRQSDWVSSALSSPLVREAIAAALVAGAGAAAAVFSGHRPSAEGVRKAGTAVDHTAADGASAATGTVHAAADTLTGLAAEAARKLIPDTAGSQDKGKRGAKQRRNKPKMDEPQPP